VKTLKTFSVALVVSLAANQAWGVTIVNGAFSAGLSGWTITDSVADGGGFARLSEDPVLILTSLEQQFVIPDGAVSLSFDYVISSRESPAGQQTLPDAFQASLLNPLTFESLLHMGPPHDFLQQDRGGLVTILYGKVSISGNTVTTDLSSIPGGTNALLAFDLLGSDDGFATHVDIDNVGVRIIPEPLTLTGFSLTLLGLGAYLRRRFR